MQKKLLLGLMLSIVLPGTAALAQSTVPMPTNPDNNTLLYFGNDKYFQCIDFQDAADTSSYLRPMLQIYNIHIIDPENCPEEYLPYTALTNTYPFFIVVDRNASPICSKKGYDDVDKLREFLISADSGSPESTYTEVIELYNKKKKAQEKARKYNDMIAHGRKYDFSAGFVNSWLSPDVPFSQRSRDGYAIMADYRQNIAKGMDIYAGLGFDHSGGIYDKTDLVENSLYLPLGVEVLIGVMPWKLFSQFGARMEVWGSANIKSVELPDYERWNAGTAGEIVVQSGSFDIHLRYSHGFIPRFTSPNQITYINSLTFGLRIRYGE